MVFKGIGIREWYLEHIYVGKGTYRRLISMIVMKWVSLKLDYVLKIRLKEEDFGICFGG